jgi:hypothetical protein
VVVVGGDVLIPLNLLPLLLRMELSAVSAMPLLVLLLQVVMMVLMALACLSLPLLMPPPLLLMF